MLISAIKLDCQVDSSARATSMNMTKRWNKVVESATGSSLTKSGAGQLLFIV
jgi:hypothetical protein